MILKLRGSFFNCVWCYEDYWAARYESGV